MCNAAAVATAAAVAAAAAGAAAATAAAAWLVSFRARAILANLELVIW